MAKSLILVSWLLLAAIAVSACLLYAGEVRARRQEREDAIRGILPRIELLAKQGESQAADFRQLLSRVCEGQATILRRLSQALAALDRGEPAQDSVPPADPAQPDSSRGSTSSAALEELPALPEGVDAASYLRENQDLRTLVGDARFNPSQRELPRPERFRLHAELVHARAKIEMLEADIHVAIQDGMEELRAAGNYVDYAPGEAPPPQPGVTSAAEELPGGGMRVYYLEEESFPEVYQKRREKAITAETALRTVIARLNALGDR